jgi:hypothetical protein
MDGRAFTPSTTTLVLGLDREHFRNVSKERLAWIGQY